MRSKRDLIWIYLFLAPAVIIFFMFYLIPIVTVLTTSFTSWDGYNAPLFIGLKNYMALFQSSEFHISLRNLLLWSLVAAVFHVGYGVLIGVILSRKPFGWRLTRGVFMIPNVISAAAWAMIYKFIFNNEFGVLNSIIRKFLPNFKVNWFYQSPAAFWAVTLTWLFYSVVISLIVLNELMAVPQELHEAAKIDGANSTQILSSIELPLCRNAIGTSVILAITSRVAMYEAIALTTRGGPGDDTLNIPLILVKAINNMNYGYANASAVVMFVIGILTLLIINYAFQMKESVY